MSLGTASFVDRFALSGVRLSGVRRWGSWDRFIFSHYSLPVSALQGFKGEAITTKIVEWPK